MLIYVGRSMVAVATRDVFVQQLRDTWGRGELFLSQAHSVWAVTTGYGVSQNIAYPGELISKLNQPHRSAHEAYK